MSADIMLLGPSHLTSTISLSYPRWRTHLLPHYKCWLMHDNRAPASSAYQMRGPGHLNPRMCIKPSSHHRLIRFQSPIAENPPHIVFFKKLHAVYMLCIMLTSVCVCACVCRVRVECTKLSTLAALLVFFLGCIARSLWRLMRRNHIWS